MGGREKSNPPMASVSGAGSGCVAMFSVCDWGCSRPSSGVGCCQRSLELPMFDFPCPAQVTAGREPGLVGTLRDYFHT